MLFNEQIKLSYINGLTNEREKKDAILVFKDIAPLENSVNIDISAANIEQTKYIIQHWVIPSYKRYIRFKKILNNYIDYQIAGTTCVNNFKNLTNGYVGYNVSASVYTYYVKDSNDLFDVLTILFGEPSPDNRFVYHFAYLCLLFNGFDRQQILSLSSKNIDFDNYTINGMYIESIFWDVIITALNTQYISKQGGNLFPAPAYLKDNIIKFEHKNYIKVLQEDIAKIKKEKSNCDIPSGLSLKTIETSGKWYRAYMYQQSHKGQIPNFVSVYDKQDFENYKNVFWG